MKNSKGERWARQIMRAEVMYTILTCYNSFYMMKLHLQCLKNSNSNDYGSAERVASFMSAIFKLDCKASDLMVNDNELCDKIIEEHSKLSELLAIIKDKQYPFTKEDVMSFMNYEYHNNPILNMRNIEWQNFSFWVMLSARRVYTVSDIKPKCVEYRVWDGGGIKSVDSRLFRKNFICMERDLWEIVAKRMLRERKRNSTI